MTVEEFLPALQARHLQVQPIAKPDGQVRGSEIYLSVPAAAIVDVCRFLLSEPEYAFNYLSFLTAIDWKTHFEVVYYLVSTSHGHKVVLKVRVDDRQTPEVPSVMSIWPAADWQEREVYDLFGIRFSGHSNLRRLLLPEGWEGHPLRKDYVQKPDRYD
jgi:NADH-quinone oxidoreductase subunit C